MVGWSVNQWRARHVSGAAATGGGGGGQGGYAPPPTFLLSDVVFLQFAKNFFYFNPLCTKPILYRDARGILVVYFHTSININIFKLLRFAFV